MVRFETEESAFNFAVEYLKEISDTLKHCKVMRSSGNIDGWLVTLQTLYTELSVKTNDVEDQEIETSFRKIYPLVNNKIVKMKCRGYILNLLHDLEIKLRKKLQQKGMLLPSKADPRFAVLER